MRHASAAAPRVCHADLDECYALIRDGDSDTPAPNPVPATSLLRLPDRPTY